MQRLTRSLSASTSPTGISAMLSSFEQVLTTCSPQSAEQIQAWVARQLPADAPKPSIARPINYVKIITVSTAIIGGFTFIVVASPYVVPILQNRNLWAAFSLIAVLLFTSGHMFNHIRKVPYVSGDGKGGLSYFAGGFSNQFGLESQIVAAMCESHVAFAIIILTDLTRRCSFICNHLSCAQGASHRRPPRSAVCRLPLERCPPRHVQLPSQRLPTEERWIPILAAPFLGAASML